MRSVERLLTCEQERKLAQTASSSMPIEALIRNIKIPLTLVPLTAMGASTTNKYFTNR